MKAIIKPSAAPGLVLQDVPEPTLGINDLLIQVIQSSICGTDVHINLWDAWAQKTIKPPMIIGHEFVGKVVETGANVQGFKKGDLVVGEGHLVCGKCRNCMEGKRHLCPNTQGVGVNRNGAFAEYVAIPAENAWHADPKIPLDVLSCFDPLGNAVHTALSYDILGEDILITGAGPIGCMTAAICKQAGARTITITDLNENRLQLAQKMGATAAVLAHDDLLKASMQKQDIREGFTVGLEMSGNGQALNQIIAHMATGGNIALLGILPPSAAVDWIAVVFKSLTLKGIYGRKMYDTWFKTTAMLQTGLDISPVITHHFPYTDFKKGFELMEEGKCGKVVLQWQ